MTLVVKKMEMPNDCEHCPFKDYEQGFCMASGKPATAGYYDWEFNVRDDGFKDRKTKRHPRCPLRPYTPFHDVYEELIGLNLFRGKYDAKHGDKGFMYGVSTVMEWIAYSAGKYSEFESMFYENMEKSEEKTEPCKGEKNENA